MTNAETILDSNLSKWKKLPAGEGRCEVARLHSLSDDEMLKSYDEWAVFWRDERGWEYERYGAQYAGRKVLEIGSGLGFDALAYSKSAAQWVCADIIADNVAFVQRIAGLKGRENITCQHMTDVFTHDFGMTFDGFHAHGVLHHIPFEAAQKEVAHIDQFLNPGAVVTLLMYPFERWEFCGKPDFTEFGCMTDGKGTPWAEWYDETKILDLMGAGYDLNKTIKWGYKDLEFVNFELVKK